MRRREAIKVLREICECVPDAFVSSVSLSPKTFSRRDFELRINAALTGNNLMDVETLVRKNGLMLNENNGSLLIYGSKTKKRDMQIVA
ncbi:MAG: hypothetical protein ABSF65_10530 [Candidatus Bathyarchaeia archaeon]|jgi:hypothetical protein